MGRCEVKDEPCLTQRQPESEGIKSVKGVRVWRGSHDCGSYMARHSENPCVGHREGIAHGTLGMENCDSRVL